MQTDIEKLKKQFETLQKEKEKLEEQNNTLENKYNILQQKNDTLQQENDTNRAPITSQIKSPITPPIESNMKYGTPILCEVTNYQRDDSKHDYLRLVSWNVNMERLSAYTPNGWNTCNDKWDHVYSQVKSQRPDIIIFQEIPIPYYESNKNKNNKNHHIQSHHNGNIRIHPLIKKFIDSNGWYVTNSTRSHCGHTLILISKRIENEYGYHINYDNNIDPLGKWPAIIIQKKINKNNNTHNYNDEKTNYKSKYQDDENKKKLILFGVHLLYGNGGSIRRKLSFDRLYQLAKQYNMDQNFVLIGDTNMRDYDEQNILNNYKKKGITSCWEIINPEHLKLNNFMATFYRNFFQIGKQGTTRYDKIFLGKNIKCISLGIFDESVSENIPFHFLSDHRGVVADIEI